MPRSRLAQAIVNLVPKSRGAIRKASVSAVLGSGGLEVSELAISSQGGAQAHVSRATPITNEPEVFAAGRLVWIAEATDGTVIVLGSVR